MKIPAGVQACLWTYDVSSLDLDRDRALIITQVLNYGRWKDVRWLLKAYSKKDIIAVLKNPSRGSWFPETITFWIRLWNVRLPKNRVQKALLSVDPSSPATHL